MFGSFLTGGLERIYAYPTDYRGGKIREQIGWNLAENLTDLNIGVKEWVGLLAYRVTGRTEAFFLEGCG